MSSYRLSQLRSDVREALLMAGTYSFLALVILIAFGLFSLAQALLGHESELSVSEWFATVGVLTHGYFVGSLLAALAVFVLRPLRQRSVGWALTGAGVALAAYGTMMILLDHVFYEPVGRIVLAQDVPRPRGDVMRSWPFFVVLFSLAGAAAGLWWRTKEVRDPNVAA